MQRKTIKKRIDGNANARLLLGFASTSFVFSELL